MPPSDIKKIVLAYSGGLDTSVIVPWLKEHYPGSEVICFCADVGQGDDMSGLNEKALRSGCSMTRSGSARVRLHPSGQAPPGQGGRGWTSGLGCAGSAWSGTKGRSAATTSTRACCRR